MMLPLLSPGNSSQRPVIGSNTYIPSLTACVPELCRKPQKPALNGHLHPSCSLRRLDLPGQFFWWYPHPAWVHDYTGCVTACFSIKFSESRLSIFISFFFLMGTNCSWQHSGWSNISANVKGLTTNEVWPYQEPGPIHLMADLLSPCATTLPASSVSLAAIFHHWIAHRPCQNSRPCVQFFFSPPSLCILGYSGNRSVCLGQWIGVHLIVCLSIRHSNIVDTQPASVW